MRTQLTKIAMAATFGLALALTFSCSSDKDDDNPAPTPKVSSSGGGSSSSGGGSSSGGSSSSGNPGWSVGDVYVVGYQEISEDDYASMLWKVSGNNVSVVKREVNPSSDVINRWVQELSGGRSVNIAGGNFYVSGNDVYVAGNEGDVAMLWKNGVPKNLSNENANASSVYVAGSDVYVAGEELESGYLKAFLWKNEIAQYLEYKGCNYPDWANVTCSAWASSVFVSGGDVYVAGTAYYPCEDNGNGPCSESIILWKNGAAQKLAEHAEASSVYVSGNDVYVAGVKLDAQGGGSATIWKNGTAQKLSSGNSDAIAYSVYVDGSDVYATGCKVNAEGDFEAATLWKNGVAQILSTDAGCAESVFVVR